MKICSVGGELFDADRQTDRWTDRHNQANIHLKIRISCRRV